MQNILAFVLGGGRGTRLQPLTQYRSKPAVPLAGKYRLIDIPISNCLNSGINRIYVLTQFNSVSLHRHIRHAYVFDPFGGGFVEILAAQQTPDHGGWYQGTADAVRQNLRYMQQAGIDYVLILSGDQLYRMDYRRMLETHRAAGADVTIAGLPVDRKQAAGFGIMRVGDSGRVEGFLEKPKTDADLALVRTDPAWIEARGIASRGRDCLASMGIYLFNRDTLVDVLTKTDYHDFGKEIFPASIRARKVQLHLFDGYWEDIGTIESFYHANLQCAQREPAFPLESADFPIYTRARFLQPSRIDGAHVSSSLIADGCMIGRNVTIENSIVGLRCRIEDGVTVRNSVLMGSDYYPSDAELAAAAVRDEPVLGVGAGTVIDGAIIDKNCRIGRGCRLVNEGRRHQQLERPEAVVCDGIVVVPKGAVVPHGWRLE